MTMALYVLVAVSGLIEAAMGISMAIAGRGHFLLAAVPTGVWAWPGSKLVVLFAALACLAAAALHAFLLRALLDDRVEAHTLVQGYGIFALLGGILLFLAFPDHGVKWAFLGLDALRGLLLAGLSALVVVTPNTVRELRLPAVRSTRVERVVSRVERGGVGRGRDRGRDRGGDRGRGRGQDRDRDRGRRWSHRGAGEASGARDVGGAREAGRAREAGGDRVVSGARVNRGAWEAGGAREAEGLREAGGAREVGGRGSQREPAAGRAGTQTRPGPQAVGRAGLDPGISRSRRRGGRGRGRDRELSAAARIPPFGDEPVEPETREDFVARRESSHATPYETEITERSEVSAFRAEIGEERAEAGLRGADFERQRSRSRRGGRGRSRGGRGDRGGHREGGDRDGPGGRGDRARVPERGFDRGGEELPERLLLDEEPPRGERPDRARPVAGVRPPWQAVSAEADARDSEAGVTDTGSTGFGEALDYSGRRIKKGRYSTGALFRPREKRDRQQRGGRWEAPPRAAWGAIDEEEGARPAAGKLEERTAPAERRAPAEPNRQGEPNGTDHTDQRLDHGSRPEERSDQGWDQTQDQTQDPDRDQTQDRDP